MQAHLSSNTTVELYQINGVPLTEINATHTAIDNIGIDSYTINLSSTPSVLVHLVMQRLVVSMYLQVRTIDLKLCKLRYLL